MHDMKKEKEEEAKSIWKATVATMPSKKIMHVRVSRKNIPGGRQDRGCKKVPDKVKGT